MNATSPRDRPTTRMRERLAHIVRNLFTRTLWIVVVGTVVLASCGDDGPSESSESTIATVAAVDRDAAIASAIDIRASGCGPRVQFGSGTSIFDGLIVTAAHVVAGADKVEVIDTNGETVTTDVVFFDPDLDVAALRPAAPVGIPVALRTDRARADEVSSCSRASLLGSWKPRSSTFKYCAPSPFARPTSIWTRTSSERASRLQRQSSRAIPEQ